VYELAKLVSAVTVTRLALDQDSITVGSRLRRVAAQTSQSGSWQLEAIVRADRFENHAGPHLVGGTTKRLRRLRRIAAHSGFCGQLDLARWFASHGVDGRGERKARQAA
jgi:hypothetical protein